MSKKEIIYLASDHAGFHLKEKLRSFLEKLKYEVEDFGPKELKKDDDYPDYIIPCARKVARNKNSKGIILGYSGQGEAIAANKVKGIRAVVYYGKQKLILKLAREHNDANILSLGANFLSARKAKTAIKIFLNTKFSKSTRHKRRLKKIEKSR